jgi:CopG family transcriptional regulator/antitoxin EndoAI
MRVTKIWNISLPPEMAKAAEKAAKDESRTKSELIREALRQYLWARRWKDLRFYGEEKARRLGMREEDVAGVVREARTGRH